LKCRNSPRKSVNQKAKNKVDFDMRSASFSTALVDLDEVVEAESRQLRFESCQRGCGRPALALGEDPSHLDLRSTGKRANTRHHRTVGLVVGVDDFDGADAG